MRRVIVSLFHGVAYELGRDRAVANVGDELADLERALASVDALGARLAARAAHGRAA
jgi:hypothetical protein